MVPLTIGIIRTNGAIQFSCFKNGQKSLFSIRLFEKSPLMFHILLRIRRTKYIFKENTT